MILVEDLPIPRKVNFKSKKKDPGDFNICLKKKSLKEDMADLLKSISEMKENEQKRNQKYK